MCLQVASVGENQNWLQIEVTSSIDFWDVWNFINLNEKKINFIARSGVERIMMNFHPD